MIGMVMQTEIFCNIFCYNKFNTSVIKNEILHKTTIGEIIMRIYFPKQKTDLISEYLFEREAADRSYLF